MSAGGSANAKRLLFGVLQRNDYHSHELSVQHRLLVNAAHLGARIGKLLEQVAAYLLMAHFTSAEAKHYLDLVSVSEEAQRMLYLGIKIMLLNTTGELNLLQLDGGLFLFCFFFLLFALKPELAVVKYTADRRLRLSGHKHKVKPTVVRYPESGIRAHDTELLAVLVEKSDFLESNRLIDESIFCCYCSSPPKKMPDKIKCTKKNSVLHTSPIAGEEKYLPSSRCGRVRTESSSLFRVILYHSFCVVSRAFADFQKNIFADPKI